MELLLAHLFGDYVLQSDWMAQEKTKRSLAAAIHAALYTLPFVLLTRSVLALAFILVTHFIIDRWRLARYVIWAKNFLSPKYSEDVQRVEHVGAGGKEYFEEKVTVNRWWHPFDKCSKTGYYKDMPPWLATWLMIICDNTLHLLCNLIATKYF